MRFTVNTNALLLVAASIITSITGTGKVSAHPTDDKLVQSIVASHILEGRLNTKSQCGYFADPHNCVPAICRCQDDRYYALNRDNLKAGKHGCDPPWDRYPGGPCTLKVSCCPVPTKWGNYDDNPVLT
ncbi:hypothetical protein QR685DRAFT_491883 [Neurospora intermedia]|uniref:Secreted protein n=1 Tax=Neurospora intermedia TaxID=5142 RepID=A0ABR3DN93_NEUIN